MNSMYPSEGKTAGQVLTRRQLYKAYPDLSEVSISHDSDPGRGSYSPNWDRISLPDPDHGILRLGHEPEVNRIPSNYAAKGVLLHELQHAVQQREGFARGANPDMFSTYLNKEVTQQGVPPGELDSMARDIYMHHAGETEARNVQTRAGYSTTTRSRAAPWTTEDIPRHEQILGPGIGLKTKPSVDDFIGALKNHYNRHNP